ncbi:uncharacterized protein LOC144172118 [Haemaphysalis longicornis]
MPGDGATATTTPLVIVSHPREPGIFTGADETDVDDWLSLFERVSAHNRWDPTIMLANVIFYLKEESPARKWFETNETDLTSWEVFKTKLREVFGKPLGRQVAARKELASRAQTSTESYVAYIQDVLALCSKADSTMPEADKVGHILKGIADDAFHLLICKDCATVDSIIKECRRFEEAKGRRIAHNFARLPHTAATSSCEDGNLQARIPCLQDPVPSSSDITKIVRRELEAMTPTTAVPYMPDRNDLHTVAVIQAVVRDQIANMGLHPVCSLSSPFGQGFRSPGSHNERPPPRYPRRNPAEWRTPDDKPICFHCSRVGHIARYCRSRRVLFFRNSYSDYSTRPPFGYSDDRQNCFSSRPELNPTNFNRPLTRFNRSPSPQRRQSRSPQPRRPSPTSDYARPPSEN